MLAAAIAMSSPRKEAKKENEQRDKDDEENPTNAGPGITEWYEDCLFFLMYPALSKGLYQ
jgi:hypothetical protein